MKTAIQLLQDYLGAIQDPQAAAALFAEDGVLELPYLKTLGLPHRVQGREQIQAFIAGLLKKVPDFRFRQIQFFIDTPTQAFGEYSVEAAVPSTGQTYRQTYAGRLVAENGQIVLLRESMDTLAAQRAFTDGHISTIGDHDKTQPTEVVVSAYYRVHPEDRQTFIDAVKPEMQAAQQMAGCVYYAFSQDLLNPDVFHLSEGWADIDAYERHEQAATFLEALATVVKNVRILHREGIRYTVAQQHIDDPRDKVAS